MEEDTKDLFLEEWPLSVGDKVPDFSLTLFMEGKEMKAKISDYEGKWLILFFYPADFTFICPTELEEMSEYYAEFQKENAEVISISTDTVFVHKAWKDSSPSIKEIKYPMAADPAHQLTNAFGVHIPEEGVALRGTFLINPKGFIVLSEINDNSIGRNAKELLRKLKAAKFVDEHEGYVCPAKWEKEGDETLKPGMDLVGKI